MTWAPSIVAEHTFPVELTKLAACFLENVVLGVRPRLEPSIQLLDLLWLHFLHTIFQWRHCGDLRNEVFPLTLQFASTFRVEDEVVMDNAAYGNKINEAMGVRF